MPYKDRGQALGAALGLVDARLHGLDALAGVLRDGGLWQNGVTLRREDVGRVGRGEVRRFDEKARTKMARKAQRQARGMMALALTLGGLLDNSRLSLYDLLKGAIHAFHDYETYLKAAVAPVAPLLPHRRNFAGGTYGWQDASSAGVIVGIGSGDGYSGGGPRSPSFAMTSATAGAGSTGSGFAVHSHSQHLSSSMPATAKRGASFVAQLMKRTRSKGEGGGCEAGMGSSIGGVGSGVGSGGRGERTEATDDSFTILQFPHFACDVSWALAVGSCLEAISTCYERVKAVCPPSPLTTITAMTTAPVRRPSTSLHVDPEPMRSSSHGRETPSAHRVVIPTRSRACMDGELAEGGGPRRKTSLASVARTIGGFGGRARRSSLPPMVALSLVASDDAKINADIESIVSSDDGEGRQVEFPRSLSPPPPSQTSARGMFSALSIGKVRSETPMATDVPRLQTGQNGRSSSVMSQTIAEAVVKLDKLVGRLIVGGVSGMIDVVASEKQIELLSIHPVGLRPQEG
ncbi:hypothetical protein PYCC9005_004455 [Savitreella phatthalungensis]